MKLKQTVRYSGAVLAAVLLPFALATIVSQQAHIKPDKASFFVLLIIVGLGLGAWLMAPLKTKQKVTAGLAYLEALPTPRTTVLRVLVLLLVVAANVMCFVWLADNVKHEGWLMLLLVAGLISSLSFLEYYWVVSDQRRARRSNHNRQGLA